jgi:hypothetical protein
MSPERGGYHEGFGTDFEAEVSEERAELDAELDAFQEDWGSLENDPDFAKLMSKWRTAKDTEKVRKDMKSLENALTDAHTRALDDTEINEIIRKVSGGAKAVEEEDDEDDFAEAA